MYRVRMRPNPGKVKRRMKEGSEYHFLRRASNSVRGVHAGKVENRTAVEFSAFCRFRSTNFKLWDTLEILSGITQATYWPGDRSAKECLGSVQFSWWVAATFSSLIRTIVYVHSDSKLWIRECTTSSPPWPPAVRLLTIGGGRLCGGRLEGGWPKRRASEHPGKKPSWSLVPYSSNTKQYLKYKKNKLLNFLETIHYNKLHLNKLWSDGAYPAPTISGVRNELTITQPNIYQLEPSISHFEGHLFSLFV